VHQKTPYFCGGFEKRLKIAKICTNKNFLYKKVGGHFTNFDQNAFASIPSMVKFSLKSWYRFGCCIYVGFHAYFFANHAY
jgi:hypothetical protein